MKLTLRTLDGELSDLEVELPDYINSVATKVQKLKKPDEKVWIRMWIFRSSELNKKNCENWDFIHESHP